MERITGEPIPSSVDDLEKIEDMIVEHETFMDDLAKWHKELEPVVSIKLDLIQFTSCNFEKTS